MKKYLLLLFLLPCVAFGQIKTKERVFNGYTIKYTYNDTIYAPAWEGTKRLIYFKAVILVFKDGKQIGEEVNGVYCFDAGLKDDPEIWINKAKQP